MAGRGNPPHPAMANPAVGPESSRASAAKRAWPCQPPRIMKGMTVSLSPDPSPARGR